MTESRALGLTLITMGRESVRDLVEARVDLEQSIAKFAAERATAEDIAEIKKQHANMIPSSSIGHDFIAADLGFHTAIANACHNPVLARFFFEIRQPVRHWMEQKYRFDWGREHVAAEHEAIMDAIEAHDVDAAQSAMRTHIKKAGEKLVAAILEVHGKD
ncbi:FadR/GntR family transcriptional regulator [Desulfoluna limicola]|nr:FCD domain-containing protein [Desulfoluna limicola]